MTELQFLDRQEARTRGALIRSARRVEDELSRALPLERAVREHPVLSLGAGAAGGVVAGYLLGRLLSSRGSRVVLRSLRAAARPALRDARSALVDALRDRASKAERGR